MKKEKSILNIQKLSDMEVNEGNNEEVFFRKGYSDGYAQAIDDLINLSNSEIDRKTVLKQLNKHINNLNKWYIEGDCSVCEFPPSLNIKQISN